jgi:hypothetical protein
MIVAVQMIFTEKLIKIQNKRDPDAPNQPKHGPDPLEKST